MTVADLKHRLSAQELLDWIAYDNQQNAQRKRAITGEQGGDMFAQIATANPNK